MYIQTSGITSTNSTKKTQATWLGNEEPLILWYITDCYVQYYVMDKVMSPDCFNVFSQILYDLIISL